VGYWELTGVVSFGTQGDICGVNSPLVVTRVDNPAILSWINKVVSEDIRRLS
jgi:hypothetical protein